MTVRASVIIPTYNEGGAIADCLTTLLDQEVPRRAYEVIVVDNGSDDGTCDVVRRYPVRLIQEGVRHRDAARNTGVRVARGSVLAFLNAPCRPYRSWLRVALEALDRGADCVAGCIEPKLADRANPWEQYDAAFFLRQQRYVASGWAATANLVVRREIFERVGPFRLLAAADTEWGLRASSQGVRFRYVAEARVWRVTRRTEQQMVEKVRRTFAGSGFLERQRSVSSVMILPLLGVAKAGVLAAGRLCSLWLQGRMPFRTLLRLLLRWPMLEWLKLSSFVQGWRAGASVPSAETPITGTLSDNIS